MKKKELEKKIKEFELILSNLNTTQVESNLFEKGFLFYNIFNSIPIAIAISKLSDGAIVEVNDNFLSLTGYEREEVIGKITTNLGVAINPIKRNEIVSKLIVGQEIKNLEIEIITKSKEKINCLKSLKMIDFNGEQLIYSSFINITKQKKAEKRLNENQEKFQLIFENSLAPIVIADDNGNYLEANKAAAELFEYSIAELKKMNVKDLNAVSTNNPSELYKEYIQKNEDIGEFTFVSKSGKQKTILYQAVRIKPDFNLSIITETTEQKRISEELSIAKLRAEEAMHSKQQFLANMSHEIRTPLNSIIGFTNVLLKSELNEEQKDYLDAIKTSGNFLNILINDILDLAKVDAGKMTFEEQPFEIVKSIKTILHPFDLKIIEKNLVLEQEYDSAIPKVVLGDYIRLNQVISNLISNAIKFTNQGTIIVKTHLKKQEEEKVFIEFTITDTGIGIAKNKLDTIFNLFEQAELNTFNKYGGTGLGLAIVKKMIELQRGSIKVKSKLGKGSSFSFILPFKKTKFQSVNKTDIPQLASDIKNLKVLVAEDATINQLLIKVILKNFGFSYEIVNNGKAAIEKLKTNTYDIILMDLHMPEMNGFEATAYIRNTIKSTIPIIALTADVTSVDFLKCQEYGMNDYAAKPIEENLLYLKIIELVPKQ